MSTNEPEAGTAPAVRPALAATPAPQKTGPLGLVVALVVAALCFGGIVWLVKFRQAEQKAKSSSRNRGDIVTPVIPATVLRKDVPIYLDGLGTVQAFNRSEEHTSEL